MTRPGLVQASRARRAMLVLALTFAAAGCGPTAPPVVIATPPPPTDQQKLLWILQLEDQRIVRGPETGQDLIVMLGDLQAHIRRRAALAAGRAHLTEAVDPLSGMLATEADPEVRQMAAFALGLIGSPMPAAALVTALGTPDPLLQGRAAEALGTIGHEAGAPAIATMIREHLADGVLSGLAADDVGYPKSPSVEAVRLGIYALVKLGAYDELTSTLLEPSGQPRSRWWPVAYAFQRVGDPRASAPLTALLQGDGQITRAFAARGLGTLKHAAAAPALTRLATAADQPVAVRIQAIRALAAIAQPGSAKPLLDIALSAKVDPNLLLETLTALGQLRSAEAVDVLLDLASSSWPSLRAASLVALARIDADTFITVLSSLDADPHWSVRAALASALGELGAERGGPRLKAMLRDTDQRVIPAVLGGLAAAGVSDVAPMLAEHLSADDPVLRMAAANGLMRLEARSQVPALLSALNASQSDPSYVGRAAVLNALATLDPEAARPALTAALDDREWSIRIRAAELLRRLDPTSTAAPAAPAPDPVVPELSTSETLLTPQYTPTAYIDTAKGLIEIELAVVDAPRTVANFTALARKGFFTNVPFHRVVPDFVVQGGDPRGDGEGGPGYTIRDEINQRPYMRGTVGMALDWADTGGSQFFITHSPQPHLDGRYTVFGQVVSGMDVVDRLQQWDVIRSVRVWDGVAWVGSDGTR